MARTMSAAVPSPPANRNRAAPASAIMRAARWVSAAVVSAPTCNSSGRARESSRSDHIGSHRPRPGQDENVSGRRGVAATVRPLAPLLDQPPAGGPLSRRSGPSVPWRPTRPPIPATGLTSSPSERAIWRSPSFPGQFGRHVVERPARAVDHLVELRFADD